MLRRLIQLADDVSPSVAARVREGMTTPHMFWRVCPCVHCSERRFGAPFRDVFATWDRVRDIKTRRDVIADRDRPERQLWTDSMRPVKEGPRWDRWIRYFLKQEWRRELERRKRKKLHDRLGTIAEGLRAFSAAGVTMEEAAEALKVAAGVRTVTSADGMSVTVYEDDGTTIDKTYTLSSAVEDTHTAPLSFAAPDAIAESDTPFADLLLAVRDAGHVDVVTMARTVFDTVMDDPDFFGRVVGSGLAPTHALAQLLEVAEVCVTKDFEIGSPAIEPKKTPLTIRFGPDVVYEFSDYVDHGIEIEHSIGGGSYAKRGTIHQTCELTLRLKLSEADKFDELCRERGAIEWRRRTWFVNSLSIEHAQTAGYGGSVFVRLTMDQCETGAPPSLIIEDESDPLDLSAHRLQTPELVRQWRMHDDRLFMIPSDEIPKILRMELERAGFQFGAGADEVTSYRDEVHCCTVFEQRKKATDVVILGGDGHQCNDWSNHTEFLANDDSPYVGFLEDGSRVDYGQRPNLTAATTDENVADVMMKNRSTIKKMMGRK